MTALGEAAATLTAEDAKLAMLWRNYQRARARRRVQRGVDAMTDRQKQDLLALVRRLPAFSVAECLPCRLCRLDAHDGACVTPIFPSQFSSRST